MYLIHLTVILYQSSHINVFRRYLSMSSHYFIWFKTIILDNIITRGIGFPSGEEKVRGILNASYTLYLLYIINYDVMCALYEHDFIHSSAKIYSNSLIPRLVR